MTTSAPIWLKNVRFIDGGAGDIEIVDGRFGATGAAPGIEAMCWVTAARSTASSFFAIHTVSPPTPILTRPSDSSIGCT